MTGSLITCLGRLFANFLQLNGFTLGIEDIWVTEAANKKRRRLMRKCASSGQKAVEEVSGWFYLYVKFSMLFSSDFRT